jgi:hypothetical protein
LDWGSGGPSGTAPDTFSIRWQGNFTFNAETYTFTVGADDGVRLKIDGVTHIDDWTDHAYRETSKTVTLTGTTHLIEVEYYENGGEARVEVRWVQGEGCPTNGPITNLQNDCSDVEYFYLSPDGTVLAGLVTDGNDILTLLVAVEEDPDIIGNFGTVTSQTTFTLESIFLNDPAEGISPLDSGSSGNITNNGNILNQTIILSGVVFPFNGFVFLSAEVLTGVTIEATTEEKLSILIPHARAQAEELMAPATVNSPVEIQLQELKRLLD